MALPFELYRPIIQNVDTRSDLYRLLFVSRAVSYEAERVLYRTIHIDGKQRDPLKGLFLRLSRCTRVARYIRELVLWDILLMHSPKADESDIQDPVQFLNQILRPLANLRVLILKVWNQRVTPIFPPPPPPPLFLSPRTFSGCTFKLAVLKLFNYSAKHFPDIDLTQIKELSLRSFYLAEDPIGLQTHPDPFPSLQILTLGPTRFHTFNTFIIGRIKALQLCSVDPSIHFGETFANVTSLKINWRPNILMPFPSVRYIYVFHPSPYPFGDRQLLRLMATFKHLEKLCLAIYEPLTSIPPDLHVKLFSAIGNLQELVLVQTSGLENLYGDMGFGGGQLWRRGGKEPVNALGPYISSEWKDACWF